MPIHDWTLVKAGIFHDFHHAWIEEMKLALNRGLLPSNYYALAERLAGGFGPDVLTLEVPYQAGGQTGEESAGGGVALRRSNPKYPSVPGLRQTSTPSRPVESSFGT